MDDRSVSHRYGGRFDIDPRWRCPEPGLQRTVLEDPAAWDRHERHTGVGGVGLYYIVPARYGLLEAHGEWQLFDADIRIASLTRESPGIPSVLGWDILRRFAIAMDWSRKIVELH